MSAADETRYYMLQTAEDADRFITDEQIESALDWFDGEPRMPTDEFLDRLFTRYSGPPCDLDGYDECDLDQLDNDAARRIMARARKMRREREG